MAIQLKGGPGVFEASGNVKSVAISGSKGGFYRRHVKRVFDILFILLSAPVLLPVTLILLLITACQGGKPLYSQRRIGRGGRIFRMLKIRTMVPDADQILESYLAQNPQARLEWDENQKLKQDPRITALGRFLRKSSLDELPQFWNVLTGKMSLIGPRPMMPEQSGQYPGTAYYQLRPGISGSWQVSARNGSSFASRAKFDTEYNNQLSLKTDVDIFVRTIGVVLSCTGY
jgi:exopolysaccharide production protein ExoY